MKIIQFVHTLTVGDAISGEVLLIDRLLKEFGKVSEIVALHAHPDLKDKVSIFDPSMHYNEDTMLLLHYSIASPQNSFFVNCNRSKRALIYHNITAAHWFERYNYSVTAALIAARAELKSVAAVADFLLADSSFNAEELRSIADSKDISVLPLALDPTRWNVPANPGIVAAMRGHGGKNLLHVGRIAPNKKLEDIIKAFYFYHHKINRKSKLWLVGSDIDTEIYSFELRELVDSLSLRDAVTFTGPVADTELKAFFEECDLYLCMSEHEGFCVPLIEAMYFKKPIIAYASSAVPETLGDAGVIISEKLPEKTAELIEILIADPALREQLTSRAQLRLNEYAEDRFRDHLKRIFSF
jgi:glycosyltransferase involved in cell wall biosynthesis